MRHWSMGDWIQAAWRACALTAVVPLIAGHGGGPTGCQIESDCPPRYELSGSDVSARILLSGQLEVSIDGSPSTVVDYTSGTIGAIALGSYPSISTVRIAVTANGTDAGVGEIWLLRREPHGFLAQQTREGKLKLLDATINAFNGGRLEKTFIVTSGFNEFQGANGPSGAGYILSGGARQDDILSVGDKADFYINGILIHSSRTGAGTSIPAFALTPVAGDTLRIRIEKDSRLNQTGQLWLHAPSGLGRKLSHISAYDQNPLAFDQEFVIL